MLVTKKQNKPNFPKNEHFISPNTNTFALLPTNSPLQIANPLTSRLQFMSSPFRLSLWGIFLDKIYHPVCCINVTKRCDNEINLNEMSHTLK